MEKDQIKALFEKYNAGTLSPRERTLLESWYAEQAGQDRPIDVAELHSRLKRIASRLPIQESSEKPLLIPRLYVAAAAAVIFIVALGYWFTESRIMTQESREATISDIAPGTNRAVLTLADGMTVDLSSEQTGIMVGDEITYVDGSGVLDDRQQTTDNRHSDRKESPISNVSRPMSLTTPKGGTYQIVLPDGTRVWLNAGSTLKYPSRFTGNTREVFLEGEGFFEVSQQGSPPSAMRSSRTASGKEQPAPFIIKTRGQQTTVLGTEFNISAYPDEKEIKTTLASGSVKVTALKSSPVNQSTNPLIDQSAILEPNEQSILSATGLQTRNVDVSTEIAWKNGDFVFRNEDLETALRKVARWYDVEIVYGPSAPKNLELGGWVSRSKSLSAVLKVIGEAGDVTFNITGRRIMVTK